MSIAEFRDWALDPHRTDEEGFFAERVVEWGVDAWRRKHGLNSLRSWEEDREFQKRRRLNPAHRVQLERSDVNATIEIITDRPNLSFAVGDDRPLRDVSGLRFFPHLRQLDLGQTEIEDLTPLTALPELEDLRLNDGVVEDLRPVAALTKLRRLQVWTRQPWPCVDGWSGLQHLEWFWWNGNPLVMEGLGSFPHLREARICEWITGMPVRDATRLPDMPKLEWLELNGIHRLDGIERWLLLRSLNLRGSFRDLAPLTKLARVTHLRVDCDRRLDLAPLCRMPSADGIDRLPSLIKSGPQIGPQELGAGSREESRAVTGDNEVAPRKPSGQQ